MNNTTHIEPKADITSEKRLLGAITCDVQNNQKLAEIAFQQVLPAYFFYPFTKELFEFIKNRFINEQPYDIASIVGLVPENLKDLACSLADERFYTVGMFNHDLKKLKSLYELRPKIKTIDGLFHQLKSINNPEECLTALSDSIASLQADVVGQSEDCKDYEQLVDEALKQPEELEEIKTDLKDWPPFPNNCMITIAGRSGTGKTWAGLFFMETILKARPDTKAVYFNLEMRPNVMLKRHLQMLGHYEGSLKQSLRGEGASELLKRDVHKVSRPDISIDEIELIATAQNLKKKVSVIVVDYVGRVSCNNNDKDYLKQDEIAKRLGGLAIKLGCIVIPLQQVNREKKAIGVEDVPKPWEAAGSQGCERSSEWWLGIHKPDIYDPDNPAVKDLFIFQNSKQRGEHGYFAVYHEFKDGQFHEINQFDARKRFEQSSSHQKKNPFAEYYKK